MGNYKLLVIAALAVLALASWRSEAAVLCGEDVTNYQPIDHTRWRTENGDDVAERVIFGYPPNHAFYLTMTFNVGGGFESAVKFISRPGVVFKMPTCKEMTEAEYNASHEGQAASIDISKTTHMQWEPGD